MSLYALSKYICACALILFCILPSWGQKSRCHGKVQDESGVPMAGVRIILEGLYSDTTDSFGEFSIDIPRTIGIPSLKVIYPCYKIEKSTFNDLNNIDIILSKKCHILEGKVVSETQQPLANHRVQLRNFEPWLDTITNRKGEFRFILPASAPLSDALGFFVNNKAIEAKHIKFSEKQQKVTITYIAPPEKLPNKEASTENLLEQYYNELVKTIVFLDTAGKPLITDQKVHIEGFVYDIDKTGRIELKDNDIKFDCILFIEGHEILSRPYDPKNLILTVTAKPIKEILAIQEELRTSNDPLVKKVAEDVTKAINLLEVQKQKITEESAELTRRLESTEAKLRNAELTPEQAIKLRELIAILRDKIILNGIQLEKLQSENRRILDNIQNDLAKKQKTTDTLAIQITEIGRVNKALRFELTLAIVSLLLLVIASIYLIILSSRLRRQKNEIMAARKQLEENYIALDQKNKQIEKAYFNIKKLSEIGQNITSILTFTELNREMYKNVNSLIDAPIFGIGILNEFEEKIEFENFVENGEVVNYYAMSVENLDNFLALCLKSKQQIIINDIEKEYVKYFPDKPFYAKSTDPQSLIFLPLIIDNDAVGVVTFQNFKKNAYQEVEADILVSLTTYIAVAYDNSRAYEMVKAKNRQITDSIRYAQTIQRTILPDRQVIANSIPEHFILFKPKDIVSGDFYWFYQDPHHPNVCYIALADCTGHGVPGALMSMIGFNALQKSVDNQIIENTGEILDRMSAEVNRILKQDERMNTDGIDIVICRITKSTDETVFVQVSGARRPLYLIRKDRQILEEIKGERRSVGGIVKPGYHFSYSDLQLSKGDSLYLCSDGFADQNSREYTKFRSDFVKETLLKNSHLPMEAQYHELEKILSDALSFAEQRDDISIIGLKL